MISVSPLHRRLAAPWAAPDQLMWWDLLRSFERLRVLFRGFCDSHYLNMSQSQPISLSSASSSPPTPESRDCKSFLGASLILIICLEITSRCLEKSKPKTKDLKVLSWEVRWFKFTHFDVQDSLTCLFYIHHFSGLKIIAKPEGWLSQIGHEPPFIN